MLDTLRRIIQEVNAAPDLDHALSIIVLRVKQAMAVDVCTVYLMDPANGDHVLMATDGLNPQAVGTVRMIEASNRDSPLQGGESSARTRTSARLTSCRSEVSERPATSPGSIWM